MLHKSLSRQLRKNHISENDVDPNISALLQAVSDTYNHADDDRKLIERSFDISSQELNQLNYQLQSERDRAQAIIHSIVDGLVVIKKDLIIDIINPQAEVLFDIAHNQKVGHTIYELGTLFKGKRSLLPEEGFITRTIKEGIVVNTTLADDLYIQTKSGKRFPVVITTTPLLLPNTNELYGVLLVLRDISKEKQQHEVIENEVRIRTQELKSERNEIAVTLASISDAVITLDTNNTIGVFNKAAEQLLGIASAQAIGRKISEIITVFINNKEIPSNEYSPPNTQSIDVIIFNKNSVSIRCGKTTLLANMTVGRIQDNHGVINGNIITLHDVSKEKQLEEMKIDFVSMAAHELRTPLTAIRGIVSILNSELSDKLNPEQVHFMDILTISIVNLANLINNLLNVSRIEQNSLKLDMHIVDLQKLTKEIIDGLINTAKSKQQTLLFETDRPQFSPIFADSFRIGEVITNLIGNAINYTPINGKIIVRLQEIDSWITLSVTDTGEGIPSQSLDMLFTKFFRVAGPLEQGSKGTGLGLYISKSIIDMHNGKIAVESTLGQGSNFHFSLPVAQQSQIDQDINTARKIPIKFGIMINEERRAKRLKDQLRSQ